MVSYSSSWASGAMETASIHRMEQHMEMSAENLLNAELYSKAVSGLPLRTKKGLHGSHAGCRLCSIPCAMVRMWSGCVHHGSMCWKPDPHSV
jgi:hypothetical protein